MKNAALIMDIDGTICPLKKEGQDYSELVPYLNVIEKMKQYQNQGFRIVLFTSRNMKTFEGNIGLINAHTAKILLNWLEQWEIPYDEIVYGKPWPGVEGFYIDDRSVRPDEFLEYSAEELEALCKKSRKNIKKGVMYHENDC